MRVSNNGSSVKGQLFAVTHVVTRKLDTLPSFPDKLALDKENLPSLSSRLTYALDFYLNQSELKKKSNKKYPVSPFEEQQRQQNKGFNQLPLIRTS